MKDSNNAHTIKSLVMKLLGETRRGTNTPFVAGLRSKEVVVPVTSWYAGTGKFNTVPSTERSISVQRSMCNIISQRGTSISKVYRYLISQILSVQHRYCLKKVAKNTREKRVFSKTVIITEGVISRSNILQCDGTNCSLHCEI